MKLVHLSPGENIERHLSPTWGGNEIAVSPPWESSDRRVSLPRGEEGKHAISAVEEDREKDSFLLLGEQ